MNILFVIKRYPSYGGIQVVTSMLSRRFMADGHHVIIVPILEVMFDGIDDMMPAGVEVIKMPQNWHKSGIDSLHNIIVNENIDVIINQWALRPDVGYMCNRARKGTKCKLLSVLHGAADTTKFIIEQKEKVELSKTLLAKCFNKVKLFLLHEITRFSVKYVYHISDQYVLLSQGFIPQLVNYAHLKEKGKLSAIGNAIAIPDDGFKYNQKFKEKILLYIGRMDPFNKRVDRIVEAWERVYKDFPEWKLELVGEGPQLPMLKEYVKTHNIERVSFYGFQKEPPRRFYEKASILLLTSDLEGFGLVIIEAMQFGVVPVVYGSYVAVYDIISNGVDGFITPIPYNKTITEERLRSLMSDNQLRERMAQAAIVKSKEFTLENIVQKWYSLFKA